MPGGALERVGQTEQGRLAPRAAEKREPHGRPLAGVAGRYDDARVAGLGADRSAGPPWKHQGIEALARHHLVHTLGSRDPDVLGAAEAIRRGPEPRRRLGGEEEDLPEAQ